MGEVVESLHVDQGAGGSSWCLHVGGSLVIVIVIAISSTSCFCSSTVTARPQSPDGQLAMASGMSYKPSDDVTPAGQPGSNHLKSHCTAASSSPGLSSGSGLRVRGLDLDLAPRPVHRGPCDAASSSRRTRATSRSTPRPR